MCRNMKREKALNLIVHGGMVVFFLFFFIKACPLVAFDVDDWIYLGVFRVPIPIWQSLNPARVFPESLMPAAGWLAARIIYPFCGDYVFSVTVISAVLITFLIMAMCVLLQRLLLARCHLAASEAMLCEILFIVLFFLIFRNRGTSACMFTAADLCCIYFYTMSGILNAILVLAMLRFDNMTETFFSWKPVQRLLFGIGLYFALFSNLFHSAIMATCAGGRLLICIWGNRRELKQNIKYMIRENIIDLAILFLWGVVLFFEANGMRAATVENGSAFNFLGALRQLMAMLQALSVPFVILMVLLSIMTVFYLHKKRGGSKGKIIGLFMLIICSESLLTAFLLLLNAEVGYMSRIDATWGIWFYLITMLVVAFAYLMKEIPAIRKLVPVVTVLLIFAAIYPDGRFLMSTRGNTDYQTCAQLGHYVIDSIVEVSREGRDEVTIKIPEAPDDLTSLAYNDQIGECVAACLYTQGIISNRPRVHTMIDKTLNGSLADFPEE